MLVRLVVSELLVLAGCQTGEVEPFQQAKCLQRLVEHSQTQFGQVSKNWSISVAKPCKAFRAQRGPV
jgi:hypothetical protein